MNRLKLHDLVVSHRIKLLYFLLFIVLLILFDFPQLITDSNLLINIDPKNAFSVFTHSWDSTFGLGQSSNWSAAYLFPNLISRLLFFELLGQRLGQSVYFSLLFVLGSWGILYLINTIFYSTSENCHCIKKSFTEEIALFFSSLFYVSNIYFVLLFVSASTMTYSHIALPFQIGLLVRIVRAKKTVVVNQILFSFATLLMSGTSPPYILISLSILVLVIVYEIYLCRKQAELKSLLSKLILRLFVLTIITILINAIWILPTITHFYTMSSLDISSAMVETPQMHNKLTTYLNIFRNMGLWSFGDGYNGKAYYNFADIYLHQRYLHLFYFSGTIFLIISSLVNKSRKMLFFVFLYVVFVPLAVGINQGLFSGLYQWIYNNLPGFSVFRGSYKFVGVLILSQSIGIASLVLYFRSSKKLLIVWIVVLIMLILINGFPIWSKRLFEEGRFINGVPQHYQDATKYFSSDDSSYRIWLLPDQYLGVYSWGKIGANIEAIWRRPLVSRLATSSRHPMNIAVDSLMKGLKENNYDSIKLLIQKYNIKYIVIRGDASWKYYPELAVSENRINNAFRGYPHTQIGALKIYTVPEFVDGRIKGDHVKGFYQISPSLYRISLQCNENRKKSSIKFSEKRDNGWAFYLADPGNLEEPNNWISQQKMYLSLIGKPRLSWSRNKNSPSDVNEWTVDTESIPCYRASKYIYLFYNPQFAMTFGMMLSATSLIFCLIPIVSLFLKRRRV